MALMDEESRNLLQQSLRTQQQMVGVLQEMRGAMQSSADLARRMASQEAQERRQAAFNGTEPQNGDAHGTTTPSAGSQAGIRQAMATPMGHLGDNDQQPGHGATQTTPVDNAQAGPTRASRGAGGAQAAPQGPAPAAGGSGAGGGAGGGTGTPTPFLGGDEEGQPTAPGGGAPLNPADTGNILRNVPVIGGTLASVWENTPFGQMVNAGKKAFNFYSSQRDKDDYYRSIEGGSHYNAMGERIGEEWNTYKNILSMSPGESRAAYKDVTRMGFAGGGPGAGNNYTRQNLMDVISHTKNTLGMSEQESVSSLQVALQGSGTSLKQFVNVLEQVSETARKAGVNTQMARQMQIAYQGSLQQQGIGGAGAQNLAQSITDANLTQGKRYAQNVNSMGAGDQTRQYMAAAQAGISPGELQNLLAKNDPRGTAAMQKVQSMAVTTALSPSDQAWIKQTKAAHPDMGSDALAQAFAQRWRQETGMQSQVFAARMSAITGQQWKNPDDAFQFAVGQITGDMKLKNNKLGTRGTKKVEGVGKNESPAMTIGKDVLSLSPLGFVATNHDKIGKGVKNAAHGVGSFLGLTNDAPSVVDPTTGKPFQEAAHKKTKDSAALDTMFGKGGTSNAKVQVDLTPDAKKLLKAMVVTGGDPYAAAGAASAGRPTPSSSTPTR